MLTVLLALQLATSAAAAAPCGNQDCEVVADMSAAMDSSKRAADTAQRGRPQAKPWTGITKVKPGDYSAMGLKPAVMELALTAFSKAWRDGETTSKTFTVIDYSLPSSSKRMWVIDLQTGEVLFNDYVAHGKHSGGSIASRFSNVPESNKSSVGLLKTAETYQSRKFGYALRLDGLEQGINHNVRDRAIVMHKSDYVTPSFIKRAGRAGRSLGCTAIDPKIHREVIDAVKGGSLIFAYGHDSSWLANSEYLGEAGREHLKELRAATGMPTLRRGDEGPEVEQLQQALKDAGFLRGKVDGDFGWGTWRAVKRFQADRGLEADGVVGSGTWSSLGVK